MSTCIALIDPAASDEPGANLATDDGMRAAWLEHGSALRAFAARRLGDRELAEDAVQETFIRAWRKLHLFDATRGSLRSWLYAIMRNIVVDMHRARLARPQTDASLPETPARDEFDPLLSSMTLVDALQKLSVQHRELIVHCYLNQRPYAEVAELLGVPVGTVRSRLFYARGALGGALRAMGEGQPPAA
jgi:RNA polymerase sigma-70 factor (ECF subfamily)